MSGLLLEIYFKIKKQIFIMNLIMLFIWLVVVNFVGSQVFAVIYLSTVFIANGLLVTLTQRKDYDLKLYKAEKMLPIKREYIVLSKYISQLFVILIAIVNLLLLMYLSTALGKNYFDYGFNDSLTLLSILISFIFQMVSFFYLGLYIIDFEKGDFWIVVGIFLSVMLTVLEIFILSQFNLERETGNYLLCFISSFILLISYFICAKQFAK